MKNNISSKLALLIVCLLISITANAYDFKINGIYYNITSSADKTVEVSNDGYKSYNGSVVIPAAVTIDGATYSVTSIGKSAFRDCKGLTSVVIPKSVMEIGEWAFLFCSGLTKFIVDSENNNYTSLDGVLFNKDKTTIVAYPNGKSPIYTIPNSVTNIGKAAFSCCSGLTSITIPNSVTEIGSSAFSSCSGLTSITIPNSVTNIGMQAFYYCKGLTSITIPNSVTEIGEWAFNGCLGLTKFIVDSENNNYSAIDGVLFNKDKTTIVAYPSAKKQTKYTIPNSVTLIGDGAFYQCRSLISVVIPNSVTSIGVGAFEKCSNLTSVVIPNSVTLIDASAFIDCTGLTSITIPNSVTDIGAFTFLGCIGLTSVTIPNSVIEIGRQAFDGCKGLDSVTIPNSVKKIDIHAFSDCIGLKSIIIPNSVTEIGEWAFFGCENLKKIYNYSKRPQSIFENVFEKVDKKTCILYVPKGTVETYRASNYWKDFINIKEI